jgi:hypothetical protein
MHPLLSNLPLHLGSEEPLIRRLIADGHPAAVLVGDMPLIAKDRLHLVFDWDSTLVDRTGDDLINRSGRAVFADNEWERRTTPHLPGPLFKLLIAAQAIPQVRISILTARTTREAHRVLTTLDAWQCRVDALHCSANGRKGPISAAIEADLFFDDIRRHADDAAACGVLAGWVPYGSANE